MAPASRPVLCSSSTCTTPRDIDASARVDEQQRDRDAEAEHGRDHRLPDAVGHQLRVARARLGDALEGDDHADHGADQSEQRTRRDGEAQERLEALEPSAPRAARPPRCAARRPRRPPRSSSGSPRNVASTRPSGLSRVGRSRCCELARHLAAHARSGRRTGRPSTTRPMTPTSDDHVADRLALLDALPDSSAAACSIDSSTPRDGSTAASCVAGRSPAVSPLAASISSAGGLAREHARTCRRSAVVVQIAAAGHRDEAADAHHLGVSLSRRPRSTISVFKRATRPVSVISRWISNQSRSSSAIDGSALLLAELGEELVALRELRAGQRVVHDRRAVAGHLAHRRRTARRGCPRAPSACVSSSASVDLVGVELRRQAVAARLRRVRACACASASSACWRSRLARNSSSRSSFSSRFGGARLLGLARAARRACRPTAANASGTSTREHEREHEEGLADHDCVSVFVGAIEPRERQEPWPEQRPWARAPAPRCSSGAPSLSATETPAFMASR